MGENEVKKIEELKLTPSKREYRKTLGVISDLIFSIYKESKIVEGNKSCILIEN